MLENNIPRPFIDSLLVYTIDPECVKVNTEKLVDLQLLRLCSASQSDELAC